MKQVSVVIPNYNNEQYIGACLDALLKNKNIREVIAEDGKRMWYNFGYAPSFLRSPISNLLNAAYASFRQAGMRRFIVWLTSPFNLNSRCYRPSSWRT